MKKLSPSRKRREQYIAKMKLSLAQSNESEESQDEKQGRRLAKLVFFPFFLIHMFIFGTSGFYIAYFSGDALPFIYLHGGIAIYVYMQFYIALFGADKVKWMVINAALGIFGIYQEIKWLLSKFDRNIEDYSVFIHAVPFAYYVLYTFLLYQFVLIITDADINSLRKKIVQTFYVLISIAVYLVIYFKVQTS